MAQFQGGMNTRRIGNYPMGAASLYRHTAEGNVWFSMNLRDQRYRTARTLNIRLGNLDNAKQFLENILIAHDTMEVGDAVPSGLPDENIVMAIRIVGVREIVVTAGHIGEYGILNRRTAQRMLNDLNRQR